MESSSALAAQHHCSPGASLSDGHLRSSSVGFHRFPTLLLTWAPFGLCSTFCVGDELQDQPGKCAALSVAGRVLVDAASDQSVGVGRPAGGMRADARGKWGHDLFETVNAEQEEKPSLLRKSLLF